jgi:hypothetical protein
MWAAARRVLDMVGTAVIRMIRACLRRLLGTRSALREREARAAFDLASERKRLCQTVCLSRNRSERTCSACTASALTRTAMFGQHRLCWGSIA